MIYDISYKTLIFRNLRFDKIRFDKKDGFTRIYDGIRYLTSFDSENYGATYNNIRYLISLKSSITYIFSYYFAKIKVDSHDSSLAIEKRMTLNNVIIHIKSVLNKDKNHYYYKIFLEECSYQLPKKTITKVLVIV